MSNATEINIGKTRSPSYVVTQKEIENLKKCFYYINTIISKEIGIQT